MCERSGKPLPGQSHRGMALLFLLLTLPAGRGQATEAQSPPPPTAADASPEQLFETHCSVCHSLELPRSQRLDRNTWRWVMDDMVNQFGATWINERQQRLIIDYLAEHYGPDRPRERATAP